ncbi:hypothetical protein KAR91_64270 [Candidatus Pacearchaeota archaeon]|nr:hypothetical protein [Candidatus Pacearchaeota archaeon]
MKTAEKLFKTHGEASKYCNDNGFDVPGNENPWELADKIIKIRADQDKITRHASIEEVNHLYQAVDNDAIDCDTVTSVIINTKAI